MKITNKTIRTISIISAVVAVVFFIFSLIFYFSSITLDYMLVVAITIGVGPPAIAGIIHDRWKNKIEKAIPEFLRDLSTASRTGIPLQVALEHASNRMYGPLTDELKILVAHMSWGMSFDDALLEMSERVDLPLVKKAVILIIEAGKHGGDLSDIFESTAKYVEVINGWTEKRRMQTVPYLGIFYFSVFIFLFIIIVISKMMFTPMSKFSGSVTFLKPILTQEQTKRLFLDTALLESLFGGLVAGKINEDSFIAGLKHVMVLAIVSGLAFYFFL